MKDDLGWSERNQRLKRRATEIKLIKIALAVLSYACRQETASWKDVLTRGSTICDKSRIFK